jgi:tetratricopeptide (TPR) repeat protein
MSWLAVPESEGSNSLIPTNDIVERFLRWIDKPELREIALLASIPRTFNEDILKPLLEIHGQLDQEQAAFDWLQTMPFVHQTINGWQYHDVVRGMMLRYQRQKSPQKYRQMHTTMANFFNTFLQALSISEKKDWANEEWLKCKLAYYYHYLIADPNKHWAEAISLFTMAVRKRKKFAVEIVEVLRSADVRSELTQEQNDIAQLFGQQLKAIKDGNLEGGIKLFNKLCSMNDLSTEAKGYAFALRGEFNLKEQKWQKALADFGIALQFIPKAWFK